VVECQLPKLDVVGSSPISRSRNQELTRTTKTNLTAITALSSSSLLNNFQIQRPNGLKFLLQIRLSVDF
jgi:hypothetical protein